MGNGRRKRRSRAKPQPRNAPWLLSSPWEIDELEDRVRLLARFLLRHLLTDVIIDAYPDEVTREAEEIVSIFVADPLVRAGVTEGGPAASEVLDCLLYPMVLDKAGHLRVHAEKDPNASAAVRDAARRLRPRRRKAGRPRNDPTLSLFVESVAKIPNKAVPSATVNQLGALVGNLLGADLSPRDAGRMLWRQRESERAPLEPEPQLVRHRNSGKLLRRTVGPDGVAVYQELPTDDVDEALKLL